MAQLSASRRVFSLSFYFQTMAQGKRPKKGLWRPRGLPFQATTQQTQLSFWDDLYLGPECLPRPGQVPPRTVRWEAADFSQVPPTSVGALSPLASTLSLSP